MAKINGINVVEGDKLEIFGEVYLSEIDHMVDGDIVVWSNDKNFMRIYTTPNFESSSVMSIKIDYDGYNISNGEYQLGINGYDHYKHIVKDMSERLLSGLPRCKCAEKDIRTMCMPVNINGSSFYICTRCSGTIDDKEVD